MSQPLKMLDLGCGNAKRPGAVGVDFNDRTAADIVHNLNSFPYPFEDASFDEIYLDNVLEHLDDVMGVMEEEVVGIVVLAVVDLEIVQASVELGILSRRVVLQEMGV